MSQRETDGFLGKPGAQRILWALLGASCALSVALEFLAAPESHFGFGHFTGFYALFGLAACAALILVARGLGPVLKRREDYYDR